MSGKLYLIPSSLSDRPLIEELNQRDIDLVSKLEYFVLETPKIGRRHLSGLPNFKVYEKTFFELNENSTYVVIDTIINTLKDNMDVGVLSDAGAPGIGDMGTKLVIRAHENDIQVAPISGPSAIMMATMSSGLSGQSFAFNGYLPKEQSKRIDMIKKLEKRSIELKQSQSFIETPYRSQYIYEDIVNNCNPNTHLSICSEVTSQKEFINTKRISEWKKLSLDFKNMRIVFIIQA